ncbi:hypothetical protein SEA_LADYBIRD_62 [Mycobacterium phage LadyBird]|uniref:phosphofructokinase n=1 Tax=Mycobacterium phage LadyBird TaxID=1718166 RepID=UPI0006CE3A36|nr:phosphofructokinase [Mycobacterium phage LadyBird]ALF02203.1 hypothetical protein SEA_LADYBIRD_62 [Mycobacterium phage LadyBird]
MSILTTAEEIINGQRAQDYGDAKENHVRIANLWNTYLQKPDLISHDDVAVMMILLKIARFMENGYHHDTVVDIAGYAGVLEKMQLPEGQRYVKWVDGLDEIEVGVPAWDKAEWENGDEYGSWEGEGPGGESYSDDGPFTTTPPPKESA